MKKTVCETVIREKETAQREQEDKRTTEGLRKNKQRKRGRWKRGTETKQE